ncbi:hypothetical protein [Isoalcanivorax indicus]|uniref:hypothetical protein n=1 Tax=Isoalcanivorax indicus TaxID=2202653 RepID=UPI000DBA612E|nr:hypothetical protein [Isoalcanivorax indicus]
MTQDRDLPLGNISDVPLDDDRPAKAQRPAAPQRPPRQPSGGGGGDKGGDGQRPGGDGPRRSGGEPARRRPVAAAGKPGGGGGGNGPWILATLVLLFITLAMGAFMFRELSAVRGQLDSRISESSEQLGSLASQLSATDESLTQSSGKVQEQLDLHLSEIRKLWDVANVRNRGWIEENQKAVKALQEKLTAQERAVAALRNELNTAKKAVETAQAQAKQAADQAASAGREVQQHTVARNQMQTQIELARETIGELETRSRNQQRAIDEVRAALRGDNGDLGTRIKEIESAINAFDAYRREVNNRLDTLERR